MDDRLAILLTYTLVRGFSVAGFMYLYPLYLLSIGYSTPEIGGLATLGAIPAVSLIPLIGYMVDNGWSRETLCLSGVFTGLAMILPITSNTYPVLIVSYTLFYLSMYSWMPSRTKLVALIVSSTMLGRIYGLFSLAFNATRTATPLVMSRVTWLGYDHLLFLTGLTILFLSLTLYILLSRSIMVERGKIRGGEVLSNYRTLFTYFGVDALPLVVFVGVDSFAWRLWFPLVNAYLKEYRGLGDIDIGNFMSLIGLSMLITSYVAGAITDKLKPRKSLVIYELLGASGIILLLMDPPILYAGAVLFGFSIAFWVTAYNSLITIIYGYESIGRLRALTDSTRALIGIPAPKIGGYLLSINPVLTFIVSFSTMLSATIPILMIRSSRNHDL